MGRVLTNHLRLDHVHVHYKQVYMYIMSRCIYEHGACIYDVCIYDVCMYIRCMYIRAWGLCALVAVDALRVALGKCVHTNYCNNYCTVYCIYIVCLHMFVYMSATEARAWVAVEALRVALGKCIHLV